MMLLRGPKAGDEAGETRTVFNISESCWPDGVLPLREQKPEPRAAL